MTDHGGQNRRRIVSRVFENFVVVMILSVKLNEGEKQVEGTKGRCLQERERKQEMRRAEGRTGRQTVISQFLIDFLLCFPTEFLSNNR